MPNMEGNQSRAFQERFAEALHVRLYPNSTLHLKQLAAAIGRSEHTISRWWHGESRPSAEDIDRLAAYFVKRGDQGFLYAVFGKDHTAPMAVSDARLIEFFRKLMLDAANGAVARENQEDHNLWFCADGAKQTAPLGHDKFVGSVLGVPISGDLVRYAVGILGWIAVTVRPDDIVVRHDGRRIAPLAAEACGEWLRLEGEKALLIRRAVHVEGRWVDAYHDSAELAAAAVEKIASIVRTPRRRWKVTRLPLDNVNHPRLGKLLNAYHQAPDKILHAAADMGAFTVSSVFSVDGDEVISHHVATEFHDLEPRLNEGKNVLSRADTDYAVMVWSRIKAAKKDEPTFHELSGSVNNYYVHYLNLAMAEPGPRGRVLTSTVLLDMEPIAA